MHLRGCGVMAIEVFNRYEKKFIISDATYRQLKSQLAEYMEVDEHSRNGDFYSICNIYYDTPDNQIISRSIEKPLYKEKLRLRSYGVASPKDKVYLEIKKKYNGRVNKRRTSIILEEAYHYINTKQKPMANGIMNEQILNEIDFFLQRYPTLQPALFLSYERDAMFSKEDRSFRVTFDTNIRTRRDNLGLDIGNFGDLLLSKDEWIMEVKIRDGVPLWFAQILSKYKLYSTSFSKYGTEYKKLMATAHMPYISNKIYA